MTWLDCNQRSYIWIFGWTLRDDVRLACAQMPELFFDPHVPFQLSAKNQKIIYANIRIPAVSKAHLLEFYGVRHLKDWNMAQFVSQCQ